MFFNSLICMELQSSVLSLHLPLKMAAEKPENPLKPKFAKIEKQNVGIC